MKFAKLLSCAILLFSAVSLAAAPAPDGFVLIKGGTFNMGSPANEDWRVNDETLHKVKVSDFYLGKYEVTQKLYREVTGENPSSFKGDDLPVENITWLEAARFCNKLSERDGRTPVYAIEGDAVSWNREANGYRLPTEAEWEYAARGGTTTPFYTKKAPGADDVNFYGHYPYQIEQNYFNDEVLETRPGVYRGNTLPVGKFKPNPFGLYDIYGNVGEWCFDFYGDYGVSAGSASVTVDPAGKPSGTRRVHRGGGWNDFGKNLRSAYRGAMQQSSKSYNVGLRLAMNAGAGVKGTFVTQEAAGFKGEKAQASSNTKGGSRALIVFYSWSGNTRGVAREIKKQTGFDMVELELVKPYSDDYNTVLKLAQNDQHKQARPALKKKPDAKKWADYETIIIGYPNWWASIPMPIATLLESYDFAGKRILPFCSHGGGRFGQSITAIAKLAPNTKIGEGLSVHYSGGSSLSKDVAKWLEKNGVKTK